MNKSTKTFIYNGHEITQEHIRAKNKIIDFALLLDDKKQKAKKIRNKNLLKNKVIFAEIAQSEKELQEMLCAVEKSYGKWFADRCKEIIKNLTTV